MRYKEGSPRHQALLFPPSLDEYVDDKNPCRVIDAFVDSLDLIELGFTKAKTAHTGCKPYNPGDLLKLYIYAYLNQTSSTRRLEKECHRNLEVIWLMKQLAKLEHKIEQYLDTLNQTEQAPEGIEFDNKKIKAALETLNTRKGEIQSELDELQESGKNHRCTTEEDAKLMRSGRSGMIVGYNAQNAVDSDNQIVVHHELTQAFSDNRQLEPITLVTKEVMQDKLKMIVADAGYSNGEQVANCHEKDIQLAVPANRAINNQGDYFQKKDFHYIEEEDAFECPAGKRLKRSSVNAADKMYVYSTKVKECEACTLKSKCTKSNRRKVSRHFYEDNMNQANALATQDIMNKRMKTVEPPFATLKRMLNNGRFRCWGLRTAASEYSLGVLSYNLMRAINVLGVKKMVELLA